MYGVNLQLSARRAGKYSLVLTCHEKASGKTASVQLPFEFQ